MKFIIEIAQDSPSWDRFNQINEKLCNKYLELIIKKYPNIQQINQIELSILLTNDIKIKELNKEFRKKNKATNVLSFPDLELDFRTIDQFIPPNLNHLYLGDIAFSFDTINKEAKEQNIEFIAHFCHLLVHSILHLLGYDHQNDKEAEIMENLEMIILKNR